MKADDQNQAESVKTYRPWVGVVLSFFVPGASQFLSGKRANGVVWFLAMEILGTGSLWCLASPVVPGKFTAFILAGAYLVLWIVMLVKSYRPVPRFRRFGWISFFLVALLINGLDYQGTDHFIRPFFMPTASMSPTLQGNTKRPDGTTARGDRIFVEGYAYWFSKPQCGDIIVFKTTGISSALPENELYVKRIIGVPGDVLSIQDGHLLNHGQRVTEPVSLANLAILSPGQGQLFSQLYLANATDTFAVTNDCYFVVGDNTANSFDSRFWGPVPEKNIIGRVSKIYWPLSRAGRIQ